MNKYEEIVFKTKQTLVKAGSSFREDQIERFRQAVSDEYNDNAKWVLRNFTENFLVAERDKSPLCDDTGIPHIFLEIGKGSQLSHEIVMAIHEGVAQGLRELPGRPMAVKGGDIERIEQSVGLYSDPGAMLASPIQIRTSDDEGIKLTILLQGGGPEIRGVTNRIFHQHQISVVINEIVAWAVEGAKKLGCTPCSPAIGIGRTHYEANALMIEAMINGNFLIQNDLEKEITNKINKANIGPLGLGGKHTALATFLKIGEQRASGVRIVSLRLCCGVEPRVATCTL